MATMAVARMQSSRRMEDPSPPLIVPLRYTREPIHFVRGDIIHQTMFVASREGMVGKVLLTYIISSR